MNFNIRGNSMDDIKTLFIECIASAVNGEKIYISYFDKIDLKKIIDKSNRHNVQALFYSSLEGNLKYIYSDSLYKLKKYVLLSSVYQIKHINQVKKILEEFNTSNISVIALKGIVLRQLYPRPEFRTMSDSDLLVHSEDLQKSEKLLNKLGYIKFAVTKNHLSFKHKNFPNIDLHWTLNDKRVGSVIVDFDKQVWKNTIDIKIGNVDALSLSWQDTLIHLLMHMAGHTVNGGFGIRQLCDVVLVVEKKGNMIDWNSFINNIKSLKIEKFAYAIFKVCQELFKLKIPKQLKNIYTFDDAYLDMFIEYILSGGVYGKKDLKNNYGVRIAYSSYKQNSSFIIGLFNQIIKIIFPGIKKLKKRFSYADKYNILLPVAWINNIVYYILKFKMFVLSIPISRKKYKLYKYLEL